MLDFESCGIDRSTVFCLFPFPFMSTLKATTSASGVCGTIVWDGGGTDDGTVDGGGFLIRCMGMLMFRIAARLTASALRCSRSSFIICSYCFPNSSSSTQWMYSEALGFMPTLSSSKPSEDSSS